MRSGLICVSDHNGIRNIIFFYCMYIIQLTTQERTILTISYYFFTIKIQFEIQIKYKLISYLLSAIIEHVKLFCLTFKGPLTCNFFLMPNDFCWCVWVFTSQNHYLLDSNVYHIIIIIFSCIFLCSAKPRLLKIHQIIFCLLWCHKRQK